MMAKRIASTIVPSIDECMSEEDGNVATLRLSREISLVLCAKLAALVVLYFAFFDSSHRPQVSPVAMAQKLLGDASSPR
jgi:hypothetical protein